MKAFEKRLLQMRVQLSNHSFPKHELSLINQNCVSKTDKQKYLFDSIENKVVADTLNDSLKMDQLPFILVSKNFQLEVFPERISNIQYKCLPVTMFSFCENLSSRAEIANAFNNFVVSNFKRNNYPVESSNERSSILLMDFSGSLTLMASK